MKNIPGNIFLVLVLFILSAAGCNDGSTNPPVDEVKITQITDYPSGLGVVNVAHDGSFIIYSVKKDTVTEIIKCDIFGNNKKVIMTFPSFLNMVLSKDDSKIIYLSRQSDGRIVFHLQEFNTGAFYEVIGFNLNQNPPFYYPVEFTNDNRGVLLGSNFISLLDLETKTLTKVTDEHAFPISFSPSGNEILFHAQEYNLFRVNLDGSSRSTLAAGYSAYKALYSPDGNHIYFSGTKWNESGLSSIWKMNSDGSNISLVAEGEDNYGLSCISHDGKSLLYYSFPERSVYIHTDIFIFTNGYEKKLFGSDNNDYVLSFTNQPGKILFMRTTLYGTNIFLAEFPAVWLGNFTP